jgi:hypothetical protein
MTSVAAGAIDGTQCNREGVSLGLVEVEIEALAFVRDHRGAYVIA